jgi:hypothetical protein
MRYADLEHDARVAVFRTGEEDLFVDNAGAPYPLLEDDAVATFHGITDEVCVFGIDVNHMQDDELLVSAMCHEVAHAFREKHGLVVVTRDVEERLTDLTAIFLGFGVLTTNAAYRYRSTGGADWLRVTASGVGYLSPAEQAFLLAVQAVVRAKSGERAALAKHLETEQRALFLRAVDELKPRRAALLTELGIPPPGLWPPARELAPLVGALHFGRDRDHDPMPPVPRGKNAGVDVFRVRRDRKVLWMAGLAVPGMAVVRIAGYGAGVFAGVVIVLAAIGFLVGRRHVQYRCSDQACRAPLPHHEARCPRCGGRIVS